MTSRILSQSHAEAREIREALEADFRLNGLYRPEWDNIARNIADSAPTVTAADAAKAARTTAQELARELKRVYAAIRAEDELDALYRPSKPMTPPGWDRSPGVGGAGQRVGGAGQRLILTTGQIITPRPGVKPEPVSQQDVAQAARYCPGVRLRDTILAFGPFKGLTFEEVRWLRAGNVYIWGLIFGSPDEVIAFDIGEDGGKRIANAWNNPVAMRKLLADLEASRPDSPVGRAYRQGKAMRGQLDLTKYDSVHITSDSEGIRYLDRLLSQDWLYETTRTRLALYLARPHVAKHLLEALSTQEKDRTPEGRADGAYWPSGSLGDKLAFPAYGDGDDGSLRPSEFSVTGELVLDERTGQERWVGGGMDSDPWAALGPAAWLAHPRNSKTRRLVAGQEFTDSDPTPGNWQLDDPWRMSQQDQEQDGWVDMKVVADNDVNWDWKPGAELSELMTWQKGMDFLQRLERIGECSHTMPGIRCRFELVRLKKEIKRTLGIRQPNGKYTWRPLVTPALGKKLAITIVDADDRLRVWMYEDELAETEKQTKETRIQEARLKWRGRRKDGRKKPKRVVRQVRQAQAQ